MTEQQLVEMDIPAVKGIAKTFSEVNDALKGVSQALEAASDTLKATAFIGMVGGLAYAHFIDVMKKQIDQMAQKCDELSKDVSASVTAYENHDQQGSTKFY